MGPLFGLHLHSVFTDSFTRYLPSLSPAMAPSLWSGWTKAAILALISLQLPLSSTAAAVDPGCAPRFSFENSELTDAAIADLAKADPSSSALLGFGDDLEPSSPSSAKKSPPGPSPSCKVFPGDAAWPADMAWKAFNASLGGALIKTTPLAAPCYNNWPAVRSAAQCEYITSRWADPHLHVEDPTSAQFPIFQGRTCLPTDDPTQNCTLGGFASYSVAVTKVAQIQLALNFARNANIRLVVRNTGHDFADKSIGAGSLSIWTHKLKELKFYGDYKCGKYKGPVFKLGAGVVTEEVYAAAEREGVTAVGGECRVSFASPCFVGFVVLVERS